MKHSDSIAKLAEALAKAQGQIRAAVKNKVNPHFKSAYADLGAIMDACRDPLSKNGLSYTQMPSILPEGQFVLSTMLMHASGEWVAGEYPIIPTKQDPQGVGSALTYAKRYALSSMVGIAADEDDDGNAASAGNGKPAATNGNGQYITEKQVMELETLTQDVKANRQAFLDWLKVESFAKIPAAQYQMALVALKKKQAAQ